MTEMDECPLPTTIGAGSTPCGDDEEGKRVELYLPSTPHYKGGETIKDRFPMTNVGNDDWGVGFAELMWFRITYRFFSIFMFDICLFFERQLETAVHDTKDGNILI